MDECLVPLRTQGGGVDGSVVCIIIDGWANKAIQGGHQQFSCRPLDHSPPDITASSNISLVTSDP